MRGLTVHNGTLELVDDLVVRAPGPREVRVRVEASGLCRSDLLMLEHPDPVPAVMGHEAAGTVVETGPEVTGITVGDRVAVTCQRPCLRCDDCAHRRFSACPSSMEAPEHPFSRGEQTLRSIARSSSMAEEIVVDELQVHRVGALSPAAASLVGCAVTTGYGMVRRVGRLRAGESVAVVGVGGIGINSIQAARQLGASRVVAVDVNPDKEKLARAFGADVFVTSKRGEAVPEFAQRALREMGGPVDVVVEGTGLADVVEGSIGVLARGGRLALVGIPTRASRPSVDVMDLMSRHITIVGALNGACDPFLDMPAIVNLAEAGRLDLESQVSHRFSLAEYDAAIATLRSGDCLRVVIDMTA